MRASWLLSIVLLGTATADPKPQPATSDPRKIIEAAIAAKGGPKVVAMKSLHVVLVGKISTGGNDFPIELERWWVRPDKLRDRGTVGTSQYSVVVNRDKGWQVVQGKVDELNSSDRATIMFNRWSDPDEVLLRAIDPATKLGAGETKQLAGRPHWVVIVHAPDKRDITLYIDQQTKLLTQLTFDEKGVVETASFSDYRQVNGVQIAHKRDSLAGTEKSGLTIKTAELDAKLDPALFEKPTGN